MLRLRTRNLFVFVGEALLSSNEYNTNVSKSLHSELMTLLSTINSGEIGTDPIAVPPDDIFCSVVRMGYGKGGRNPVTELTNFYQPDRLPRNSMSDIDVPPRPRELNYPSPQPISSKRSYDEVNAEIRSGYNVGLIPSGTISPDTVCIKIKLMTLFFYC